VIPAQQPPHSVEIERHIGGLGATATPESEDEIGGPVLAVGGAEID